MDPAAIIPIACTAIILIIQAVSSAHIAALKAKVEHTREMAEAAKIQAASTAETAKATALATAEAAKTVAADMKKVVDETKVVTDKVEIQTNSRYTEQQKKIVALESELKGIREQQALDLAKVRGELAGMQKASPSAASGFVADKVDVTDENVEVKHKE